ncbi:DUF885 domain-containing protein [Psychroflexus sp. YR1-1]|uniref:DUF885 domain-containing protein n=1 Tax=Psychroflexus aurantiacus TaxID=2709310 RepID=A0A6B3R3J1_9FLAO|nr:DUF885 domain-containing protein [Psychroflexus aurantiacus]NEV94618.1 DUF885 domain-containing protein [Psychroflexus aurantiacus]
MTKNSKLSYLFLAFLLIGISCQEASEQKDLNQKLTTWLDEKHEESLQTSPLRLTALGRKDRYGELDDMSMEALKEEAKWMQESVDELKAEFDYEQLDQQGQLSYDLWIYQSDMKQKEVNYAPMQYIFDQMTSIHTRLPNMLINFHKVDSLSDMEAYISRIEQMDRATNQLLDRAKSQAENNILPPRFALEIVQNQSKSLITGQPFDESDDTSAIYQDMKKKIGALLEDDLISEEKAEELEQASKEALLNAFKPSYENLIAWTENELPNTEEKPTGVSRHANGTEYYNYRLNASTTTDLTADEIHDIGLKEVKRIQEEMKSIKEEVGFDGDLQAFFKFVNEDEQFYFPNTDEGRQAYLTEATKYIDEITKKLPDYFGILPKADLEVKRVEPFREQDGAPQHYMAGTPDGSRPGTYYVHLSDMSSMPKTTLEGVAYHEGNPGHHMQISIAQELQDIPKFRTQGGYNAYVEGWALYSEKLAKEMGQYENPYYDFGRLVNEIWRAIRLVVDTGLHSKGWTEADAIQYFSENSSISEGAIQAEVRRYMVIPGQATGYKIGMLKIGELRQKAEDELGENFDIKAFHDLVLGSGALPLNYLEKQVDTWINNQKQDFRKQGLG